MSVTGKGAGPGRWKNAFSLAVQKSWYSQGGWTRLLLPLSWLFALLSRRRRLKYQQTSRWQPDVPVVVVGNITVGGTGKTPVVASLVKELQSRGYRPGIASRGFGASGASYPFLVDMGTDPGIAGDEPVMLAQQLKVPVMVDPDRVSAARALIERCQCDLVITDDGLQHYNLQRHVEILVIDGSRLLGNGLCLPAGPLREPPGRLDTVDLILVNGTPEGDLPAHFDCFYLDPGHLAPLSGAADAPPGHGKVHAVAGIGNPERFFQTLESLGFEVIAHPFPDHHDFVPDDLVFQDDLPVVMTAKDAVKCRRFARPGLWYLPVQAHIPEAVMKEFLHLIETKGPQQRSEKGQG